MKACENFYSYETCSFCKHQSKQTNLDQYMTSEIIAAFIFATAADAAVVVDDAAAAAAANDDDHDHDDDDNDEV